MAAPSLTLSNVKVIVGETAYAAAQGATSADAVVHVPYGTDLSALTINALAGAKSSLFLSNTAGTIASAVINTTAGVLKKDGETAAAVFDLSSKINFYIAAYNAADITTGFAAAAGDTGSYTLEVIADLDKMDVFSSFTVGLGNSIIYNLSKYTYTTGGIQLPKGGLAVINATVKGGYAYYYDPLTAKFIVYGGQSGAESAANAQITATIVMLRK